MADNKQSDPLVAIGDPRETPGIEAYAEFARLSAEGEVVALVTVIGSAGSAPRGMGAAMAVRCDGSIVGTVGGGQLELLVIAHALECLEDGRPRRYSYDFSGGEEQNLEKACLGESEFFIQPSKSRERLYIFGAGHIGVALAPIAQQAGFSVTLVDDREGFPQPGAVPAGIHVICAPFVETIDRLPFDENTCGVIVTYGHLQDEAVLRACLDRPWAYLGMIGSRAKVSQVFRAVTSVGVTSNDGADNDSARAALERVHAPIGLDLGGRAPGEIAVSIAAELVAVRYGNRGAKEMRERMSPPEETSP